MREFQRKQQQFLAAVASGEGGEPAMEWDEEAPLERDYDCVICNTRTPTTPHDPVRGRPYFTILTFI